MKIENQCRGQLELTLASQPQPVRRRPFQRKPGRRDRARWWFREMHRVVDDAMDWAGAPLARPEQGNLTFAGRR